MEFLKFREKGIALLEGRGIEIGALEYPTEVNDNCDIEYVDVLSKDDACKLYPEIDHTRLKEIDRIVDISCANLKEIYPDKVDFVVINHVLEQVPNPIKVLYELFNILKPNGKIVMAIGDKNYTYNRFRPLTSFAELKFKYMERIIESTPEDYRDIVTYVHPELLLNEEDVVYKHMENFKRRREHLNVWTTDSFKTFVKSSLEFLSIKMVPEYEVEAKDNGFEYFGIWVKSVV